MVSDERPADPVAVRVPHVLRGFVPHRMSDRLGQFMTLFEVATDIAARLQRIFLRDAEGRRPVFGGTGKFQTDPHWRDCIPFYEYFHGDNGAGLGAGHQTGWTALVSVLIQMSGTAADAAAVAAGGKGMVALHPPLDRRERKEGHRRGGRDRMTVTVLADAESVARHAAELIAREARAAVNARGRFMVAFSGGRTPWMMLDALSLRKVPWEQVHVFQVDERIAPAGHADRNLSRLQARLESVRLDPMRIHAMPVDLADLDEAVERYAARSRSAVADRRCWISCISAWGPTATPHRSFLMIPLSASLTPTWRSPACTRGDVG